MTTFTLFVDGGCLDNQHKDKAQAYYSIALIGDDGFAHAFTLNGVRSSIHDHLPVSGKQTSNVAELIAWITAFGYILDWKAAAEAKGKRLPQITVKGDSKYAFDWLTGENKKAKKNVELVQTLKDAYEAVKDFVQIKRVDRSEIVEVLGH
jgi:ribonuclease HI